jgi:regulator of protease activity HflC (stomatin/prohibitin superfamily)
METISEKRQWTVSGFAMVIFIVALYAFSIWGFIYAAPLMEGADLPPIMFWVSLGIILVASILAAGFFIINPNEAKVFTLFGRYTGVVRSAGFYYSNPFLKKRSISLKVRNFSSQKIKVNDASGNPIEIAAVVVWQVEDAAKACFDVEDYENFVVIQSETALRAMASRYPYDSDDDKESLRGNPDSIAENLLSQLAERLAVAGVAVKEARITHLAYAQEIAQAMLKRQQAAAIIAARRLIVDGAVGMVEMALKSLEEQDVVKLDNERRAIMVNNLLVALVSDSDAQPVINAGSLY